MQDCWCNSYALVTFAQLQCVDACLQLMVWLCALCCPGNAVEGVCSGTARGDAGGNSQEITRAGPGEKNKVDSMCSHREGGQTHHFECLCFRNSYCSFVCIWGNSYISTFCWLQNIDKALDVAAMFRTLVYFYRLRDDPYLVRAVSAACLYIDEYICHCRHVFCECMCAIPTLKTVCTFVCMHVCLHKHQGRLHFLHFSQMTLKFAANLVALLTFR